MYVFDKPEEHKNCAKLNLNHFTIKVNLALQIVTNSICRRSALVGAFNWIEFIFIFAVFR